jgi:hypothetical protein
MTALALCQISLHHSWVAGDSPRRLESLGTGPLFPEAGSWTRSPPRGAFRRRRCSYSFGGGPLMIQKAP